jgi:hypothetical protein
MEMVEDRTKILCQNVWKIFGPNPTQVLDTVADDMNKEKLLEETGHVIAIKDEPFRATESLPPAYQLDHLPPASQVKCDNLQETNRVRLHSVIELFPFIYHHKYFTRKLHSQE